MVAALYLQVSLPPRVHGFTANQINGRRHEMGLGAFPSVSLSVARGRALGVRKVVRHDRAGPLRVKRETEVAKARGSAGTTAKAVNFIDVAAEYIGAHSRLHPRRNWHARSEHVSGNSKRFVQGRPA